MAKEAGLSAVASQKIDYEGGTIWAYYGVLDSFKLGGIELRNIPVGWSATESGEDVGTDSDGLIGTWVFYHLLTTFDYAGRQLILRRRTPETARKARAAAKRAGAEPLPLWLAREQYLHSRGSFAGVAGSGTGVVGVNFGGGSEIAAGMRGETAEQLGIRTDYDRPIGTFAQSHPAVVYPCYPKEIRLGNAVAKEVYCYTDPTSRSTCPGPWDRVRRDGPVLPLLLQALQRHPRLHRHEPLHRPRQGHLIAATARASWELPGAAGSYGRRGKGRTRRPHPVARCRTR